MGAEGCTDGLDMVDQPMSALFGVVQGESSCHAYSIPVQRVRGCAETCLPCLLCLQISRMPKANGCRPRTVVFTQGAEPTIVAVAGKVQLFPVIKVGVAKGVVKVGQVN